jgi:hypothetical protein
MTALHIHDLRSNPLMCTLPKDRVSLGDIMQVIGAIEGSREVVESKQLIFLTSGDLEPLRQAVNRWVNVDSLLN